MDRPLCRFPLSEELYKKERDYASRRSGLTERVRAMRFFEDKLAHTQTWLEYPFTNASEYERLRQKVPKFAALNRFYATCLLRYLQKTGEDIPIQHLTDFDTPEGNQVDRFLAEFLGVR